MKTPAARSTLILAATLVSSVHAAEPAPGDADHDSRMAWWREEGFGMFVH